MRAPIRHCNGNSQRCTTVTTNPITAKHTAADLAKPATEPAAKPTIEPAAELRVTPRLQIFIAVRFREAVSVTPVACESKGEF
mmetsp:Transcript_1585/g.3949  ORF Transcript_1585/g.3949 Transcript_1585/m.3949 type:complete len:83 (-) Transcript_1585:95-343(-)